MSSRRKRIGLAVLATLFLVVVAYVLYAETPADTDVFGHLTYGKLILENGGVPTYDVFSYTTGRSEWINHEWLSEVVFAVVHDRGGFPALHYLKTGFLLLYLLGFYEIYRRVSPDSNQLTFCFLAALMLLMMYPYMLVRPQLFSFLLMQGTLLLFLEADRSSPRWLLALPVVFLVWTNVHGGFIAGLGLVGVYGICSFLRSRQLFVYSVLGLIGSVGATVLNPYGLGLHEQIYRTLGNPWTDRVIEDWLPLYGTSLGDHPSLAVFLAVFLVHLVLFARSEKTWTRNVLFVLSVVTFAAGLLHVRNVAFYALVGVPSLSSLVVLDREAPAAFGRGIRLTATLAAVAAAVGPFGSYDRNPNDRFPEASIQYLREHEPGGNLATPFNWGQYAIYHLHPKFRVSLDGRYDTVYPIDTFVDFQLKAYRGVEWEKIFRNYGTDFVLVPNDSPLDARLEASPYLRLFEGTRASVYDFRIAPSGERKRRTNVPSGKGQTD